jgi:phospholipid/cholesterol/gamma-HCH transport system substrate-binding protein
MEQRANLALVGGFVLVLIAAFVAFVLWLGKAEFDREFAHYRILFPGAVTGLKEGNPVRYRGVPVGSVNTIRINPDNVEEVEVVVQVSRETPIKEDAEAALELQGITGIAYIQILGGTQGAAVLKTGRGRDMATIKARPSQLERVIQSAPELLNRFIVLVDRANLLFDEANQQAFAETLQNVRKLSTAMGNKAPEVERLLADTAATMAEFRKAATSVGAMSEDLRGDVRKATQALPGALEDIRKAAAATASLASQVDGLVADNRTPLREFAASGLTDLTQLLQDMRLLIAGLNRLTSRMESDPARFFFGDINQSGVEVK